MRRYLLLLSTMSLGLVAGCGGGSSSPAPTPTPTPAPTTASTSTALVVAPNPAVAGGAVSFTATVASASGTPNGSVTFLDGTTTLGTSALSNGVASLTTSSLSSATHSLTASYAGSASFAASTSNPISLLVGAASNATASFSFSTPHQTILGFGGAEAFYASYLDNHPNQAQINQALYDPVAGLGITFLRLQNSYFNFNGANGMTFDSDNARILAAATTALGARPTVLLSSWTPPASIKSNGSVNGCNTTDTGTASGNCVGGFGTLSQVSGTFNYAGFAQFWLNSLKAYASLGVTPDYISIQNEPDFPAPYVACLFNPTEAPAALYGSTKQSYASYGKAFDATYQAIHTSGALASVPQMVGPEAFSLYNVQSLLTEVPAAELASVAHHLYNVSSAAGNSANQVTPMTTLAAIYPTALKFETEYYQAPGFLNAIDIHNALTIANDNVYLYWALAWPSSLAGGISSDQAGLLYIDNPFAARNTWAYPNGWTYNDAYYTLKHFSYFIRPGYIRYDATITNADEDISVYQSPDKKTTVVVVLNTSASATDVLNLNLSSIPYTTSAVYRSAFATPITTANAERWNNLGSLNTQQGIGLPPQSAVTVVLTN